MKLASRVLIGCAAGLLLSSCSQNGAQAQSVETVVQNEFETNWDTIQDKSTLKFTASQNGEEFTGSFSNYDAKIKFDPEKLDEANVLVTIDMGSVDAGDSERNDALPGKEWFSVKAFPHAVFSSQKFIKTGENAYQAEGALSIRGITHSVILPFDLEIEDGQAKMRGQITINRSDFDVGTGMWAKEDWVAHDVKVDIDLLASRNR